MLPGMRFARACWLVGLVACSGAPEQPAPVSANPPPTPSTPEPPPTPTPTPPGTLRPYTRAALTMPANPDPAACDAAAEAAHAAGILDVATYWRAEARNRESTPAREQAWTAARTEAGLTTPVRKPAPLAPALVRAIRAASETHRWAQVLALSEPALASAPHHELYLWAGDALWQLGRDREARRMWSRARVLLHRTGAALHLILATPQRVEQLAWGRGGLLLVRDDDEHWVEVWGDRLERPWRRWQLAWRRSYAWRDDQLVEANAARLALLDPASGTELASVTAHAEWITTLVAAAAATIAATATDDGEIKLWGATPEHPLELLRTLRAAGEKPQLALAPDGARLAIHREDQAIELVHVPTGARRRLAVKPLDVRPPLRFQDDQTLLVNAANGLLRVRLREHGRDEVSVITHPGRRRELLAATADELALASESTAPPLSPRSWPSVNALTRCSADGQVCRSTSKIADEAAYAPDGARLLFMGRDVSVLDVSTGTTTPVLTTHHFSSRFAGVSRDASAIAIDGGTSFAVWDTRTGARRLLREGHNFLAFTPDSAAVLAHDRARDLANIHPLAGGPPVPLAMPGRIEELAFSPDGRRLALATATSIAVFDPATGAAQWQEALTEPPRALALTVRDELVYQTGETLRVRDAAGQRPARLVPLAPRLYNWSVSPDGTELLACTLGDLTTQLVDLATGTPRRRFADTCSPRHITADAVWVTTNFGVLSTRVAVLDPRTGEQRPLNQPGTQELLEVHADGAALILARQFERDSVVIVRGDGQELARLHARPDLGWLVVTTSGAVDGDAAAFDHTDALLGASPPTQRYPAVLAWDGHHVPGLLPRVLAGQQVDPPIPR